MSDQEMNEINQQLGQSDVSKYVDKIMKSRELVNVRGLPKNIPGGLPREVVMENLPGGVGMRKARKARKGGIEGGKIINETKIVDIPTPDTSSFVSRRMTLAGPGAAIKKAIGVFPFVGSAFKRGKKG
tara:strand:+ start:25 stop:408 length:384 start_codon:yes stop_codon:yes gene_type:complete